MATWRTHLVQLFRVVAGNQKENVRADILRHGIVVAHNLAVVYQEFGIRHEFGDAQHSRGSLLGAAAKKTQLNREGNATGEGTKHSQSESPGTERACGIADSSCRVYTQWVPAHASR